MKMIIYCQKNKDKRINKEKIQIKNIMSLIRKEEPSNHNKLMGIIKKRKESEKELSSIKQLLLS